jgi:4-deoxy-L-threo-5-hexosulose-uronate ketol-isomerase
MQIRFHHSRKETAAMNTEELRQHFLFENMITDNAVELLYSHYDRMIIGGAKPVNKTLLLPNHPELRSEYFLERRELGAINVGGPGKIVADGKEFNVDKLDCVYVGKGTKKLNFSSLNKKAPAVFYFLSAPAHHGYPTRMMKKEKASPVQLGEQETSNKRTIYKYIHEDGIKSCQLVMGLTILENGSVWNSVPPHTHTRRMEVYFYFDLPDAARLFHFMGEPGETRHIVVANHQAVISPPWSVHFGAGTSNYGFIWGMAGENKTFTDMDPAPVVSLK